MSKELCVIGRFAAMCALWPFLLLLLVLSWITGIADMLVMGLAERGRDLAHRLMGRRADR